MNDTKKSLRSKKKTVSKIRRAIVIVAIILIEFTVFILSIDFKVEANPQKGQVEFSFTEKSAEQEVMVKEKLTIEDDEPLVTTSVKLETKVEIEDIVENIGPEMEIGQTSGISLMNFKYAIKNCTYDANGILAENAEIIWLECQRKNLNEFAVVGIIAAESWWANPEKSELAANKKNIMSIKNNDGDYKTYETYSDCILDAIRILSEEYVSEDGRYHTGGQLDIIGNTYAENGAEWAALVAECAEMSTRALTTSND